MTTIRAKNGALATDTSVTDITFSGSPGTPTAALVFPVNETVINTSQSNEGWGVGFADFTDQGGTSWGIENGVSSRFSRSGHQAGEAWYLTRSTSSGLLRSASITAITDGVRLTPLQTGTGFECIVICFFGGEWKMFDEDLTGNEDTTHDFAHTLSGKPNLGFFAVAEEYDVNSSVPGNISFGFFTDTGTIVQRSMGRFATSGGTGGAGSAGQVRTDRVITRLDNTALDEGSMEVTANDGTNTTITIRDGTVTNFAVICLLGKIDESVEIATVDSPDSETVDWNVNDASETPQAVIGIMNRIPTVDTHFNNDDSSCMAIFCITEEGETVSVGGRHNDGADPSESDCFVHNDACMALDSSGGAELYRWNNPTFTSDGFDVAFADIPDAATTTHKFPMLFIGQEAGGAPPIHEIFFNRRQRQHLRM